MKRVPAGQGQAALPGFDDPAPASSEAGDATQPHTLFFALRPDAPAIDAIEARRRALCAAHGLAGRGVAAERLHVTLFFVGRSFGELPVAMVEGALAAAAGIASAPFEVVLDGVVSFDNKQERLPLVLTASEAANAPLLLFQRRLDAAMNAIGMKSPAGHGFTPHLTLLYDEQCIAPAPIESVRWSVREFVLIESLPGRSVHRTLGRWPVGGAA